MSDALHERLNKLRADFDLLRSAAETIHGGLVERAQSQEIIHGDVGTLRKALDELGAELHAIGEILDGYELDDNEPDLESDDDEAGDDEADDEPEPAPATVHRSRKPRRKVTRRRR
jgi:Ran GTPase-activating protein (RanGAP) involved in mRNA processing and transport